MGKIPDCVQQREKQHHHLILFYFIHCSFSQNISGVSNLKQASNEDDAVD
jgi:hypothetical protein